MKVQVSIELDDEQRVAVGLIETGKFVAASREQVREFVTGVIYSTINDTAKVVKAQQKTIIEEVRQNLGKPVSEVKF
jgi:hypothetical protein